MELGIFGFVAILFYLWPPLHVLISSRTSGGATFGWLILTVLFSWLAYAVYLVSTKPQSSQAAPTND